MTGLSKKKPVESRTFPIERMSLIGFYAGFIEDLVSHTKDALSAHNITTSSRFNCGKRTGCALNLKLLGFFSG